MGAPRARAWGGDQTLSAHPAWCFAFVPARSLHHRRTSGPCELKPVQAPTMAGSVTGPWPPLACRAHSMTLPSAAISRSLAVSYSGSQRALAQFPVGTAASKAGTWLRVRATVSTQRPIGRNRVCAAWPVSPFSVRAARRYTS